MVLYTIVPIEDIFGGGPQPEAGPAAGPLAANGAPVWGAATVELALGDRRLIVAPQADGSARLVRLISTDPADYLEARWQPGAAIPHRTGGN